jgi:hypothetical protein
MVALVLAGTWEAATFRSEDIDSQVARFAFDLSNAAFANAWVALGSFAILTGWVAGSAGLVPRWSASWVAVAGIGLVLSRAVWLENIWLLPYLLSSAHRPTHAVGEPCPSEG